MSIYPDAVETQQNCGATDRRYSVVGNYTSLGLGFDACLYFSDAKFNWTASKDMCEMDYGDLLWISQNQSLLGNVI